MSANFGDNMKPYRFNIENNVDRQPGPAGGRKLSDNVYNSGEFDREELVTMLTALVNDKELFIPAKPEKPQVLWQAKGLLMFVTSNKLTNKDRQATGWKMTPSVYMACLSDRFLLVYIDSTKLGNGEESGFLFYRPDTEKPYQAWDLPDYLKVYGTTLRACETVAARPYTTEFSLLEWKNSQVLVLPHLFLAWLRHEQALSNYIEQPLQGLKNTGGGTKTLAVQLTIQLEKIQATLGLVPL